jgi:replicative DNA helicase
MNPNTRIHTPDGRELEVIAGTTLPHSPDCEAAILGIIMRDHTPANWALACSLGVKPKAFFKLENREVWTALDALRKRGVGDVDPGIVLEELRITGKLEDAGGPAHLAKLMGAAGLGGQAKFYAEQLVTIWHLRHAITLGGELRDAALEYVDRDTFTKTAMDIGQRLMRLGRKGGQKTLAEEILGVEDDLQRRGDGTADESRWISSGLPRFDDRCMRFTGGREDQLVVIAGGSGMGKSAVLRQLAGAALKQGGTVLSFSRETSTAGFVEMLIAAEAEIDLLHPDVFRDRIPAFRAKCAEMIEKWADKTLFCVEHSAATPLLTVEDLEDQVHAFVNLRWPPHFILVDYLQLFGTRKRLGSREETVATVSHRLQALVREYPGTTMLVGVQLNETGLEDMRQIKRDENGRIRHRMPKPGDIRESQAIYHDADRVIFLYRPPVDCRGTDQTGHTDHPEIWWFQEKRRRGGCASVRCWFQKRFTRFVEIGRNESDAADEAEQIRAGRVPKGGMPKDKWRGEQNQK